MSGKLQLWSNSRIESFEPRLLISRLLELLESEVDPTTPYDNLTSLFPFTHGTQSGKARSTLQHSSNLQRDVWQLERAVWLLQLLCSCTWRPAIAHWAINPHTAQNNMCGPQKIWKVGPQYLTCIWWSSLLRTWGRCSPKALLLGPRASGSSEDFSDLWVLIKGYLVKCTHCVKVRRSILIPWN